MKNKFLKSLLCAAAIIPLASCGSSKMNSMIEELCKGFKLEGTITQTAVWLDRPNGNPTGETDSNTYNLSYYYQNNNDVTGVSQKVSYFDPLYEQTVTKLDSTFIQGADGFAYFYDLSYKNKLEAVAAVDSRGMNVNYAYYFDNPFNHIKGTDFTKISGNVYELNHDKAFYLSYMLFNQIDTVFYEVCKSAQFTIENGTLKSAKIEPISIEDYTTIAQQNRYYRLDTVVEINFSEAGKSKIITPELRETQSYHAPLQNAFDTISNNYTLKVTHVADFNNPTQIANVFYFYYTEDAIYWKSGNNDEIDSLNDVILKINKQTNTCTPIGYDDINGVWSEAAASDFSQLRNAPVEAFLPVISEVAPEIFDYNGQTKVYSANEFILPYIAAECFIPGVITTRELNGYTSRCDIKLDKGTLKTIEVDYYYNNGWDVYSGDYVLEFSNIGTTTLPYGVTL